MLLPKLFYTFTFHKIDKKIRAASNKERTLFTAVTDPVGAGLVDKNTKTGKNITGSFLQ